MVAKKGFEKVGTKDACLDKKLAYTEVYDLAVLLAPLWAVRLDILAVDEKVA